MSAADSQLYPGTPELPVGTWSYQPGEFGSFQLWQQTEAGPHYVGSVNSLASADFIVERLNEVPQPASVAQGLPDRDKLAAMLKTNGFTSRDGTYLQGGTYRVIDAVLYALSSAQGSGDCGDTIPVARWWIKHVQDQMLQMKLPSGPVGDFIFIFREQLGDLLNKGPAVTSTDREYDPNVAPCDDAEFGMKP